MELIHLKSTNEERPEDWKIHFKKAQNETHIACSTCDDEKECTMVRFKDNENNLLAFLKAGIYEKGTFGRCAQWKFGENKYRTLWIDFVWSGKKGLGSEIMKYFENYVKTLKIDGRQNIYVVSIDSAFMFYLKCGYSAIATPENDEEDEDYPCVYWSEIGKWMAKPLGEYLDEEKIDYNRELKSELDVDYAYIVKDYEAIEKKIDVMKFLDDQKENVKKFMSDDFDDQEIDIEGNPFNFEVDSTTLGHLLLLLIDRYVR